MISLLSWRRSHFKILFCHWSGWKHAEFSMQSKRCLYFSLLPTEIWRSFQTIWFLSSAWSKLRLSVLYSFKDYLFRLRCLLSFAISSSLVFFLSFFINPLKISLLQYLLCDEVCLKWIFLLLFHRWIDFSLLCRSLFFLSISCAVSLSNDKIFFLLLKFKTIYHSFSEYCYSVSERSLGLCDI